MVFAPLVPAVLSTVLSILSATAAPVFPCLDISDLNITAQCNNETGSLNLTLSNYQSRVYWVQDPSSSPTAGGEGWTLYIDPPVVSARELPDITERLDCTLSMDRKSSGGETETIRTNQLKAAFYEGLVEWKKLINTGRTRWAPTVFNSQSSSAQIQWLKFGARYHITYADLMAFWPAIKSLIMNRGLPTPYNFSRVWTFHITCTENLAAPVSIGQGNITSQTRPISARGLSTVTKKVNSAALINITQSTNAEINYPIPHTSYTLIAVEFGDLIPINELTAAFDDAITRLQAVVDSGGGDGVPEDFMGVDRSARVTWEFFYVYPVNFSDLLLIYRGLKKVITEQATAETFAYSRSCRWWIEQYGVLGAYILGEGSVRRVQGLDAAQLSSSSGNASSMNSIPDS